MNNPEFSNICLTNLLEKDAATFLRYIQDPVNHQHVQQWFDGESKTHQGYYSPPTHLLLMLTGKLAPNSQPGSFYGSKLPEGIPESLALEIFAEFTRFPMDASHQNYYEEDLLTLIINNKYSLTHRVENEAFLGRVLEYFNLSLPTYLRGEYHPEMNFDDMGSYPRPLLVTPPTYDGHFQNFVDNMDEYYNGEVEKIG